ncbi:MAG: type II secretion system F family protein [Gammaproteobacteria bacterium]|nr:type II secretion system F family protein [Gammaproteobacteria bacterium]
MDSKGKRVSGEIASGSVSKAKMELRKRGINPLKVKKKPKPLFGTGPKKKKITPKDITIFSRQLATMMSSGVPLVQSFEIVGKGLENPTMAELVLAIKTDVEGGGTMADAFRKHPKVFDELMCNLIEAGEQGGILEGMLAKIAEYKEKTESIKAKVKKAMTYPIAIISIALLITAGLLIFVIPSFQKIFEDFGAELPGLTMMVIHASEALQTYWYIVFGGIAAAVFTFKKLMATSPSFRFQVEKYSLNIPVFGEITQKSAFARFARTLSTMFAAGVPLVEALDSVSGAVGNVYYKQAILVMKDQVATGTSLTLTMQEANIFPNMVIQMASIGEEAGSLDSMLAKVADFYEEEVDNLVDTLSSLMEPVIMVVLGSIVGTIILAMYLPIFKMGEVV